MKNILFITWDGPQTTYMEGLFMPIYKEIQDRGDYKFHIIQFTWGNAERIAITANKANELGITYIARTIVRKPLATLGSILTLFEGINFLNKYIKKNQIDVVMPRSTMPAIMVNRIKELSVKLLFDADGMAIDERVDFSGLSPNSLQYRFFKKEEYKLLQNADGVITRSKKAIVIHQNTLQLSDSQKFSVVYNGRDITFFNPSDLNRKKFRQLLGMKEEGKLFVYCGSLGAQYGWEAMTTIFNNYHEIHPDAKFLILTGNIDYAIQRIPKQLETAVIVKKVPFEEVPEYLSAADIAFAIREPKFSMQAIAPIKLGEYLLMGLPTIASAGIGDSEELLQRVPNCHLFDHSSSTAIDEATIFVENLKDVNADTIRKFGINYFSIEKSAESYISAFEKLNINYSKHK